MVTHSASRRAHIIATGIQIASENNCHQCKRKRDQKIGKFMRRTNCRNVFADAVCVNHCKVVRDEIEKQGLRRIPSAGKGHNVVGGSPPTSRDTSILDGNLFATLQTEASRMALSLSKDPHKNKTVQLMEVTEKLWKSKRYKDKPKLAMKKLPHVLRDIIEADGGPTDR